MTLTVLSLLACSLYLVPLLALVALLRKPQASAFDLASKLGCWFALDLLVTFALMRLMRLEQAVFLRTALLIGTVIALGTRRLFSKQPRSSAPSPLSRADLLAVVLAALLGFAFSHSISSEYWIFDREWHVPFTATHLQRLRARPAFSLPPHRRLIRSHAAGVVIGSDERCACLGVCA